MGVRFTTTTQDMLRKFLIAVLSQIMDNIEYYGVDWEGPVPVDEEEEGTAIVDYVPFAICDNSKFEFVSR